MKQIFNILVLTCVIAVSGSSAFAKECKKGKACGNTCIAKDAVCSKDAPATKPAKECKKGKACGNTCIAKDAECKADKK